MFQILARIFFPTYMACPFLYIGIQYIASIMSRNGVDSTRGKTSTDRMLTKTSKGVLTQLKKEMS